jgi:hypothetical protein
VASHTKWNKMTNFTGEDIIRDIIKKEFKRCLEILTIRLKNLHGDDDNPSMTVSCNRGMAKVSIQYKGAIYTETIESNCIVAGNLWNSFLFVLKQEQYRKGVF